jgi:hypothetical protein
MVPPATIPVETSEGSSLAGKVDEATPGVRTQNVLERREQIQEPLDPDLYTTLRRMATDEGHRFFVSLGGGSIPGLCGNLALLKMLEELDLKSHVDEIWGTSAGAVAGGGWAVGTSAEETLALVRSLDRRGVMDVSWFRIAAGFLLRPLGVSIPDGIIRGGAFARTIDAGLKVKTFEECAIPFRCIACTDDGRAQRKIFREGPLLDAILASMSLPGILVPQPRRNGDECGYYDGGLVEKTPLISPIAEHSRSGDPRKLLLLCSHFGVSGHMTPARGFVNRFLQTMFILEDAAWSYQHAEARGRANVILMLLDPHIDDPSGFDFASTDRYYLHAREAFKDMLQNAKLALSFGLS